MFMTSYWNKWLYPIAWLCTMILIALFILDIYLLYATKNGVKASRSLPQKLSNSDHNPVVMEFKSTYAFKTGISVVEELPIQFQKRDFKYNTTLIKGTPKLFEYTVRPVERGEYYFGNLNIYASSPLRIVKRKFLFQKNQMVPVYPSIIQMQKYDFLAISNKLSEFGMKKN